MKKALIGIILNSFALYATTQLVESITHSGGLKLFVIGGVIIGLLNTFIKPFIKLLSFPLIFITGGLFLIIINMAILWLTGELLSVLEFDNVLLQFEGIGTYIISAIVFGVVNWAEHLIIKNR